jgi:hypothetical protein
MKVFKIDQSQLHLISNPDNWEALSLDKNKGLLLIGNIGVGKTYTVKKLSQSNKKGYGSYNQPTMFYMQGDVAYPIYESDITSAGISSMTTTKGLAILSMFKQHDLYLDDIGSEKDLVSSYGEKFNPIQELLSIRYLSPQYKNYMTSNLTLDELQNKYGERVISRIKEMCNVVLVLGNKDLRND